MNVDEEVGILMMYWLQMQPRPPNSQKFVISAAKNGMYGVVGSTSAERAKCILRNRFGALPVQGHNQFGVVRQVCNKRKANQVDLKSIWAMEDSSL